MRARSLAALLLALLPLASPHQRAAAAEAPPEDPREPFGAFGVSFERRLPELLQLGPAPVADRLLPLPPEPLRAQHEPTHPAVPRTWVAVRPPTRPGAFDGRVVHYLAELDRLRRPVRLRAVIPATEAEPCEQLLTRLDGPLARRYERWERPALLLDTDTPPPPRGHVYADARRVVELACVGDLAVLDYLHTEGFVAYQRDYARRVRQWRENFAGRFAGPSGSLGSLFGIRFEDPIPDLRERAALPVSGHVPDVYVDFTPASPFPSEPWMGVRAVRYRVRVGPDGRAVDVRARMDATDDAAADALFDELTATMRVFLGAPSKRAARHWIFDAGSELLTVRRVEDAAVVLAGTHAVGLRELVERRERRTAEERARLAAERERQLRGL